MENIEKSEFSQNQALSNFMSIDFFVSQVLISEFVQKSHGDSKKCCVEKKICKTENTIWQKIFSKIKLMDLFIKMHFNISVEKIYLHADV